MSATYHLFSGFKFSSLRRSIVHLFVNVLLQTLAPYISIKEIHPSSKSSVTFTKSHYLPSSPKALLMLWKLCLSHTDVDVCSSLWDFIVGIISTFIWRLHRNILMYQRIWKERQKPRSTKLIYYVQSEVYLRVLWQSLCYKWVLSE